MGICVCKKSRINLYSAVVLLSSQEKHKFLALPIDEKASHAARKMAKMKIELKGELEEEEEMKPIQHVKRKEALHPKQITGRHELKMTAMKRGESNVASCSYLQPLHMLPLSSVLRKLYQREQA